MARPSATSGAAPTAQPTARATFTTGISDARGGGSTGFGPIPASTGYLALPPHAAVASAVIRTTRLMTHESFKSGAPHRKSARHQGCARNVRARITATAQ